jgi:hypothetical protein
MFLRCVPGSFSKSPEYPTPSGRSERQDLYVARLNSKSGSSAGRVNGEAGGAAVRLWPKHGRLGCGLVPVLLAMLSITLASV